jgi:hypothetical protein
VILDAEGRLPRRGVKSKESAKPLPPADGTTGPAEEDEPSAPAADWVAVDAPHRSPQPILQRVASAAPPPAAPVPDSSPASADHKLSKSERKALKKRLLEERLHRQQQTSKSW